MNLVPHFIHEQFAHQVYSGSFRAATLFADISGFTPLTETLMQHHKDGAEVLTEVLNGIFHPRCTFLENVAAHREIVQEFRQD